ncbi:lipoprotein, putative [Geotalea daltonii FRC-32]|uniref:Lipoprotein, putative n=1 Tax=Geotalea daltonii (strain DSM 22248 / JCM 15807 / FRC-32) TaxID=316067 RepID=B9M271_GEODF|nr:hypothetical protein [Geotalea daltonii]ACM21189.1 lipoprotein, putative [Geotalea daltonii FRC-32]
MKRLLLAPILVLILITMTGCGDDHRNEPQLFFTQILSNAALDGDIERNPAAGTLTITQGNTESVFVGVDPVTGTEFRAFLDFSLTGAGGVPLNAIINSATLNISINNLDPRTATIPIRIDLISFAPPTLLGDDFDRTLQPALATTTIQPPIGPADFGQNVAIDITSLMVEAQRLGLPTLQLRLLPDSPILGLVEINDTTGVNRGILAPLLEVEYF